MNSNVIKAHANSLTLWATTWERDGGDGTTEIAFLMRRTARLMLKEPEEGAMEALPRASVQSELVTD